MTFIEYKAQDKLQTLDHILVNDEIKPVLYSVLELPTTIYESINWASIPAQTLKYVAAKKYSWKF